jgi:hypothetical protein
MHKDSKSTHIVDKVININKFTMIKDFDESNLRFSVYDTSVNIKITIQFEKNSQDYHIFRNFILERIREANTFMEMTKLNLSPKRSSTCSVRPSSSESDIILRQRINSEDASNRLGNLSDDTGGLVAGNLMRSSSSNVPLVRTMFDKYSIGEVNKKYMNIQCLQNLSYDFGTFLEHDKIKVSLVNLLDNNSNNKLDYEDFMVWWRSNEKLSSIKLSNPLVQRRYSAARLFINFDKLMIGSITTDNYFKVHTSMLAEGLTTVTVDAALSSLDREGTGRVKFKYFSSWLDSSKLKSNDNDNNNRRISNLFKSLSGFGSGSESSSSNSIDSKHKTAFESDFDINNSPKRKTSSSLNKVTTLKKSNIDNGTHSSNSSVTSNKESENNSERSSVSDTNDSISNKIEVKPKPINALDAARLRRNSNNISKKALNLEDEDAYTSTSKPPPPPPPPPAVKNKALSGVTINVPPPPPPPPPVVVSEKKSSRNSINNSIIKKLKNTSVSKPIVNVDKEDSSDTDNDIMSTNSNPLFNNKLNNDVKTNNNPLISLKLNSKVVGNSNNNSSNSNDLKNQLSNVIQNKLANKIPQRENNTQPPPPPVQASNIGIFSPPPPPPPTNQLGQQSSISSNDITFTPVQRKAIKLFSTGILFYLF